MFKQFKLGLIGAMSFAMVLGGCKGKKDGGGDGNNFKIDFEGEKWAVISASGAYNDKTYDLDGGMSLFTKRCTPGDTDNDRKNGSKSLRCAAYGANSEALVEFKSDFSAIKQLKFQYSIYGNANDQAPAGFKVQKSTDAGSTWTDVGTNMSPTERSLTEKVVDINEKGKCRVRFVINDTTETNQRRVNIDDIEVIVK